MCTAAYARAPERIVSGMPSITEMLYALELEDKVVGATTNCDYPPQVQHKEKVGGFFLNLEKVVSLKPDLVVMLESAQPKEIKRFKDYGLPVYTIDPQSVDDVMEDLLRLGKLCGKEETAKELVANMKKRIRQVDVYQPGLLQVLQFWKPKVKKNRALVIVGYDPLIIAGGKSFINDIILYAGVENVAADTKIPFPQYSLEKLIIDNPDYIIIPEGLVDREKIKSDRRWQALSAVKKNQILFIGADILSRPGPRVVEAIEKIARFVH